MNQNQIGINPEYTFESDMLVLWNDIPDIGLYMDQMVQILNQKVDPARRITPNMINNYVKDGLLEPPMNRRYSRNQIIRLFLMMQLKPVLQVPSIAILLNNLGAKFSEEYDLLRTEQKKYMSEIIEVMNAVAEDAKSSASIALQLSLKASALRHAAESILASIPDHGPEAEIDP
jgi:Domain of unknown function (DUF1836).